MVRPHRSKRPYRFSFGRVLGVWLLAGVLPAFAATLTVTNTNDSGAGSLRDVITTANAGDTIQFSVTGTITLTSGELSIDKDLTITGPGASQLAISGNHTSRVFEISSGVTVALSGLTIENGNATNSGGILNEGTLTLTNSTVSGNSAGNVGGGIFNRGTLTIKSTLLASSSKGGELSLRP